MSAPAHSASEIETVRRLVAAGYSRQQVADRTGLTRNAVIGLVYRHLEKSERTAAARLRGLGPKPARVFAKAAVPISGISPRRRYRWFVKSQ